MLATLTIVTPARAQSGRAACLARHYAAYAGAQRDYQRTIERLAVRPRTSGSIGGRRRLDA